MRTSAAAESNCPYCGAYALGPDGEWVHTAERCAEIDEIEYFSDGRIKRIKKRERQPEPIYGCIPASRILDCVAINGCKITAR